MKELFIIISLLILFHLQKVKAQTNGSLNPSLENIVPPSPNAASLGKFGSIPVGASTGIPKVSVPIYSYDNINSGLKLPISLDYHLGGIRVDEVSSNIGIGWALKAGGVISRTLRGIYDEMPSFGFIYAPPLPENEMAGNSPYSSIQSRPFNNIYTWQLDSQNDIFNFNFNGRSGKFMFGKNNDILLINQQKLKISKEISLIKDKPMISKFTITDEYGFKYIFDSAEITHNHSMATSAAVYTSSWYLTKIITPSGKDFIRLEYEDTDYTYQIGRNASTAQHFPGVYSELPEKPYSASISSQRIQGKRLNYIYFPEGVTIDFDYSTIESTDAGDFLLKKITIGQGTLQRGYKLVHDFSLNRATLKKVIPFGGDEANEEAGYEFAYEMPLPNRLSSKQDHWGFYNSNSGSLIPKEYLNVGVGGDYGNYQTLGGGNRDTDPTKCKAGSLKRITYPTGGFTVFEMEPNSAVDPRLNQQKEITSNQTYREDIMTVYCSSSENHTIDFPFEGDANSPTEFTVTIPAHSSCNSSSASCKILMEIRNSSGLLIDIYQFEAPSSTYSVEHTFTRGNLSPGTYTITAYTQGLKNYYGYINFKWRETRIENPIVIKTTIGHNQLYVGGLRVSKILNYKDNSPIPASVKEYDYVMEDGITSSGTLGVYPVYTYPVCYYQRPGGFTDPDESENYICNSPNFIVRASSTIHPLAYVSGSPVIYKRVVEKSLGNGEYLGRTERYFKSFNSSPVVITHPFPFTPPDYNDWNFGLLDSALIYSKDNSLVEKIINTYQESRDKYWQDPVRFENFRSVSIAPVKYIHDVGIPYWTLPVYFKSNSFYPSAGRMDLASTITYKYGTNGAMVKLIESYQYDPINFYLKTHTTSSSTGASFIQKYNYPEDMVKSNRDPNNVYQQMVDENIINPVIENVQFKDNRQLYLSRKNYFNPYPNIYVPKTIVTRIGSDPVETRLQYYAYDNSGKPLSQSKKNDVKISYQWGYNNSLPIAKVTNASYDQFFYTSFEEDGNTLGGITGSKCFSGTFIIEKPDLTGEYNLTYWLKENDEWEYQKETLTADRTITGLIDDAKVYPKGAEITTYTYDPIVGVTSITDTNGVIIYYLYDDFGRLKSIKDHKGNVLKSYQYHYK